MELAQLRYFRTVAKCQNMSKASGELYVTQPTLSQSVKRLESELGCALFDRYGKSIVLNSQGRIVLHYADQVLGLLDEMERELADLAADSSAAVSVSINTSTKLLTKTLPAFQKTNPHVCFYVEQNDSSHPDKDDYDICINCAQEPLAGDNAKTILRERVLLALPMGHPLAQLDEVPMAALERENFIQVAGKDLTLQLRRCCETAGFEPIVSFNCDRPAVAVDFVEMGLGVTLFPEISWASLAAHSMILRPIQGLSPTRYISISWRKNTYLSSNARTFRDFFINYMQAVYPEYVPD